MSATRIFSPASHSVSPSTTQFVPPAMWHVPKLARTGSVGKRAASSHSAPNAVPTKAAAPHKGTNFDQPERLRPSTTLPRADPPPLCNHCLLTEHSTHDTRVEVYLNDAALQPVANVSFWRQLRAVTPTSPARNNRVTLLHYAQPMDALGWTVLLLMIAAVIIRMIAAQPLFATLRICFGNWADESRQREPDPAEPAVH